MTRSSSRFSAVSHPGVSLFRRFCGTKTPGRQNLVFWTQNQQRTHHKVGTARPPKAIHTAIYAKGACPYTHRATHSRHTECAGLPWWSFGSRCARVVCRGSPIRFVPSVIIFIRYRASRPTLHINPTITSPHTHYIPSDPRAAGASFSSFSSSRQASVFDLLPSPAALATRAQGEGSPPRAAAAPSQRRPLLHHRYQSSRLARHLVASPLLLPAPPRLGTPGRSVVGPGTPLPASSLAVATPAGISTQRRMLPRQRRFGVGRSKHPVRALRQLRLPRRPSCPPQRRNSWRFRAILSRPDPVK